MEALIPGLPDDIAEECLLRVPYTHLTLLHSVCQRWRRWVHSPEFRRRRRFAGISRPLFACSLSSPFSVMNSYSTVKNITLFDPSSGKLDSIPPRPTDVPIPWNYAPHLVGLGHSILAIAWCNDVSYVHSFNLITGRWHVRPPMPGPPHSYFVCLSDGVRRVLVTGIKGENDRSLKSGMLFDLENDAWEFIPDLTDGMLQYELLMMSSQYWTIMDLKGKFMKLPPSLYSTLELPGKVYYRLGRKVSVRSDLTWQPVLDFPEDVSDFVYLTLSRDGQLVMWSMGHSECYTLNLKGDSECLAWRAHKVPTKLMGNMHYACWLEI